VRRVLGGRSGTAGVGPLFLAIDSPRGAPCVLQFRPFDQHVVGDLTRLEARYTIARGKTVVRKRRQVHYENMGANERALSAEVIRNSKQASLEGSVPISKNTQPEGGKP